MLSDLSYASPVSFNDVSVFRIPSEFRRDHAPEKSWYWRVKNTGFILRIRVQKSVNVTERVVFRKKWHRDIFEHGEKCVRCQNHIIFGIKLVFEAVPAFQIRNSRLDRRRISLVLSFETGNLMVQFFDIVVSNRQRRRNGVARRSFHTAVEI